MKGFEKDFNDLIKIVAKLREAHLVQEKLNKELDEKCNNFIRNYNIENKINRLGSLSYLLKNEIDLEKFKYFLENYLKPGIFTEIIPEIKKEKFDEKEYNSLLSYDTNILRELEMRIKDMDSIENTESTNDLFLNKGGYLINRDLEEILKKGHMIDRLRMKKRVNKIYLVVFNTIKRKNLDVLVYNYIEYNDIFIDLLYVYAMIEQKNVTLYGTKGYTASDYFFIVDKEIREKYDLSRFDLFMNKDYDYYNLWINFIQLVKSELKGNLIHLDLKNMGCIIKSLYYKNETETLKILDKNISIELVKEKLKKLTVEYTYNYLSRFLFLISDLDSFINVIKNNVDNNVNQGHRTSRGKVTYINHILNSIDKGFRLSMYNHNRKYLDNFVRFNGELKYSRYIPKSSFSFKNIHINLGYTRWYSTYTQNITSTPHSSKNLNNKNLSKLDPIRSNGPADICISNKDNTGLVNSKENKSYRELDYDKKNETIDSIFNSDVFKYNDVFRLVYNNIINIIENNPINKETQVKIETYLYNQYKDLAVNKGKVSITDVDISLFTKEFREYCLSKVDKFKYYLDSLRKNLNSDKKFDKNIDNLVNSIDIHNFYIKDLLNTLSNEEIINYMFYILFLVVTFNDMILEGDDIKEDEKTKIGYISICMNLGKYLSNAYISKLYKKYKDNNTESQTSYFKDYKEKFLNIDKQYVFNSSEFFLRLSSKLVEIMTTCGLLEVKVHDSYHRSLVILRLSNELEKILKNRNSIAVFPLNLPMIIPPKKYSNKELGGFLLNDVEYDEYLIGPKLGYDIPSVIEDNNIIYDSVNNMMRTPFKINKDLLNYLLKYNHIHKLLISSDYKHKFADIKRNIRQEREYQEYLSKKSLEKYVLLIAHIYSNLPEIYFPLKLDHRGRLYPSVGYLHYQGSELAKALILFARGDTIKRKDREAIEYLKAYGATCFGNGLNRKSYKKRLEWVSENWDNIINFETSDLVFKADDKYLFLAFCIEMRRFDAFIDNEYLSEFKTYLPIQLDGTCNGFQHLALLSNETKIFEKLNLSESRKDLDPLDFYSHIVEILNIHLEYKKKDYTEKLESLYKESKNKDWTEKIESIERLLKLGINRSIIKPAIMNKPYNATDRTLVSYIRDLLVYDHIEKKAELDTEGNQVYTKKGEPSVIYTSWYRLNKESNNCVKYEDLKFLVKSIDEIIYVKYPRIKLLTNYFHDICMILNKLNLPIIWRLPHGLRVSQKYLMKHTLKIKPFTYLSNTLTLTITDKIKMDKHKQLTAFMPNLVHSLDATTLTLLYNSLFKTINSHRNISYINFYSVHDCYGVTAKYVDLLIKMLRTVYIELYSGQGYIEKFDEDVINTIIISYGEDKCKYYPETRTIILEKRKKIVLPDLSKFLNVSNKARVYKSLSKSIFLIK